jgi:hypothetical protein
MNVDFWTLIVILGVGVGLAAIVVGLAGLMVGRSSK